MGKTFPARIKTGDLSTKRVYLGILRRLKDYPHKILWQSNNLVSKANKQRLASYHNKHFGKRCVIIGNGPSLMGMNLSLIKNEITFGMNRIYLLFDEIDFSPTYFVSINDLVLSQFADEIADLEMPKFLNWNLRKHFTSTDPKTLFVKTSMGLTDRFGIDLAKPIYSGGTVTFVALQIAYYMGFKEVVLIGIDHNFVNKGIPNIVELRGNNIDQDHFHPQYFPKGSKWQLPDLYRSEIAYLLAKQAYENDGRSIKDATDGGKCEVFQKHDFYSLFS